MERFATNIFAKFIHIKTPGYECHDLTVFISDLKLWCASRSKFIYFKLFIVIDSLAKHQYCVLLQMTAR